ncbi:two-component system response regulator [Aliidongia dinghuensis]|uniref:Two-component system response regulator n=1 Tax=Aliidongia dinghuensis TaxID=1867774 RepID=A0A8J2YPA3_9PROT|nr:HD domain-containing phosphohydrolase [Aliidongia dinghuensis]GGE98750.1 two-component system response regulator [Aliidongia dinghuensis]
MPYGPILIVDDEPANLSALRQVLDSDYRLVFARSGVEALAAAAKHQPSLILLDISMPDMNGYEVCRRLKADPRTEAIPVIFVTALSEAGDEAAGFDAGAVDYITKPVTPVIVRARVRTHLSLVGAAALEKSHRGAVYMLGTAGHFNDADTGVHIWRMAAYSGALADACGWDPARCILLELAAPLHDTGKLGIPDAILRKPAKLDPEEWRIMETHTTIGHHILSQSEAPLFRVGAEVALAHHEKWDGSGYPHGLAGKAIPESARIVAVADVFDALTMKRPYKEAWPIERAIETMLAGRGKHFEPRLIDRFIEILPRIVELKALWDSREAVGAVAA